LAEVNFQLFDAASLKKPVQGHFGELDAMAGFSDAATGKRLEADLRAAGNSDVEVFIYPNVGHAFMNDKPSPFPSFAARMEKMGAGFPPYDAATADLAWSRLFAFFSKHL
jgi:carboxymethylenebutenolidase